MLKIIKRTGVCLCGSLREYAENPIIPVQNDKDSNFFLVFNNSVKIPITCCFVCGGNNSDIETKACNCNAVNKWAENENYPIEYNESSQEYYLLVQGNKKYFLYFCPVCSGYLPNSEKDKKFIDFSESEVSEVNEIKEKIENVETLDKLINILGVPDEKMTTGLKEIKKQKSFGRTPIKQTLVYNSIAESFSLIVVENEDGKIHFLSKEKFPKEKREKAD